MTRTVQISGRRFELDTEGVSRKLAGALPEPIQRHYVVIDGRRFPPKQVISLVTGLDRADFTSHQARRASAAPRRTPAARRRRRSSPAFAPTSASGSRCRARRCWSPTATPRG